MEQEQRRQQQPPPSSNGTPPLPPPDLSALLAVLEALRRAIPAELQDQFNTLQRELLLTVRALIDWYLERLDNPELAPQVEDIPID
jgi:thioesterase domain-containing protein